MTEKTTYPKTDFLKDLRWFIASKLIERAINLIVDDLDQETARSWLGLMMNLDRQAKAGK